MREEEEERGTRESDRARAGQGEDVMERGKRGGRDRERVLEKLQEERG